MSDPNLQPRRPRNGRIEPAGVLMAFVAVFAATAFASLIGITEAQVVALWPAAGISMWACWRYGLSGAVASFIAFYGYGLLMLDYSNLLASFGNASAAYIAAHLLWRKLDPGSERQLYNTVWILFAGILLSAIATAIGATDLAIALELDGNAALLLALRWFISDVAGVAITATFLIGMSLRPPAFSLKSLLGRELAIATTLTLVMIGFALAPIPGVSLHAVLLLLAAPVVLWLGMQPRALSAIAALSLIGMALLTISAQAFNTDNQSLLETQLFLLTFIIAAQLLSGVVSQLQRANRELAEERTALEARVQERTADLEAARARAEAADTAKSEFLANTSHELRTPLNAILGMSEFLSESELNAEQRRQTQAILNSGRNLMALLNDIIDLSKVEAGKLEITPVPCRLTDLCAELSSLWSARAEEKDLSLTVKLADGLHDIWSIDALRLKQCLGNLISNAIKFTAKGSVELSVDLMPPSGTESQRLVFRVADTGIGMSEAGLAKLFQPFEQLDASITRQYGGTGLGLAITRKLAELMQGDITAQSTAGLGTTFTLIVSAGPLGDGALESTAPSENPKASSESLVGLRTLIVEDNAVNRLVVKGHLKTFNMTFDEAGNGAEALEHLQLQAYDLVLLDVHMPVMDGLEAIQRIRNSDQSWRDVPVVALTADAMSEDRDRLISIGMDGYASKPIERAALLREIARVIKR